MASLKTVALNLRITPEKKAALAALANKQRIDMTKLILPQIDRLLEQGMKDLPEPNVDETEGQGDASNPLSVRISFRPLPGDDLSLNHYAAARNIKSSEAMKLILRGWITKKPPLPKEELVKLGLTSNQLAAIGRNLNQLVKLAHAGGFPLPDELAALLQDTLKLTRHASHEIDTIVKTNLISWESDYA